MGSLHRKVALFLPSLTSGGAQRVTATLARGIFEQGFDVDVVLARAEGTRPEDWPILTTVWQGVKLRPYGFFTQNPGLGVRRRFRGDGS